MHPLMQRAVHPWGDGLQCIASTYIYTQAHTSSMHLHFIYVQIYIYIYTYVRSLRSANDGHIHRCHREEHSRGHYGNGNDPERDGRLKGKRTKRHKRRQGNCDRLIGATVKDDDKYMYTCVSIYIYIYVYAAYHTKSE